jgi:hypothetical protein
MRCKKGKKIRDVTRERDRENKNKSKVKEKKERGKAIVIFIVQYIAVKAIFYLEIDNNCQMSGLKI